MKKEKKKAVILLSGGLDSTVLAYEMKRRGFDLYALSLLSNERRPNNAEIDCARATAKTLNIPHEVIDVSVFTDLFKDFPGYIYAVGGQLSGCVPQKYRVAPLSVEIMHLLAMMHAIVRNIETVLWSIHLDDLTMEYTTNDVQFYLYDIGNIASKRGFQCKLKTPFLFKRKSEIVELGQSIGVPFESTFSCSSSVNSVPCGECEQCLKREKAFLEARVEDVVLAAV